jgi:hypothetical protein
MNLDAVLNAYHEAGHALAFVHFGIARQLRRIVLQPPVCDDLGCGPGERTLLQDAVMKLCGPQAEAGYTRKPVGDILPYAGRCDYADAMKTLARYPDRRMPSTASSATGGASRSTGWSGSACAPPSSAPCCRS